VNRANRAAALILSVMAIPAIAQEIDYDARRAVPLRRCDDMRHHGRDAQARTCYQALVRSSTDGLTRAEAHWALGDKS
jgi:hypothetical protein